jgi:6-phospho-3-hexuloisomerase
MSTTNLSSATDLSMIASDVKANLALIREEHRQMHEMLSFEQVAILVPVLRQANRIFVVGAGRSGLALRAAAMRLMHLGLNVFVTGETTTPAIQKGDLLLAASGSGTTSTIVISAEKASKAGAKVVVISTTDQSPLAKLAMHIVVLPAAQKQDFGGRFSHQYSGSLFEQGILLLTDAVFQTMWKQDGTSAEQLWKRHANLE